MHTPAMTLQGLLMRGIANCKGPLRAERSKDFNASGSSLGGLVGGLRDLGFSDYRARFGLTFPSGLFSKVLGNDVEYFWSPGR